MLKRILPALLVLLLVFTLCACEDGENETEAQTTEAKQETTTKKPDETPKPDGDEEWTPWV